MTSRVASSDSITEEVVHLYRILSSYSNHAPVLFDDVLHRRAGEHVQIDDPADGCVGQRGQRLQVDVHGVRVEKELAMHVCLPSFALFQIDVERMATYESRND